MTQQSAFSRLFRKYIDGTASADETELFLEMVAKDESQEELATLVDMEMLSPDQPYSLDQKEKQTILENIYSSGRIQRNATGKKRGMWPRIAVAASIIFCVSVGGYFIFHNAGSSVNNGNVKADIEHGSNGATLILADGRKVVLDDSKIGEIGPQNGTNLHKAGDSLLVYQNGEGAASATVYYNTLETSPGKQYSVVLPDGSKVWLNAASSLKYPTSFTGTERRVELTGEAYFEVAHNTAKPFRVQTDDQVVEVLGTHFDIKAYRDETATWTTLLQGAVKVENSRHQSAVLVPGQQAVNGNAAALQIVSKIDESAVLDWKNGEFVFTGQSLESILREVSRWYNVEVEYKDESLRREHFVGSVSKWSNASDVLDALALTGTVKFTIKQDDVHKNGKKIIVMK
ncbi:FecR domain-containing protein [Chitinophagaceae bacterium 26-R-25]|nr:FecR domain-containing protein [Chitinophagaceae bacterium 26-R-25]